jgi:hypothetical protein
MSANVRIAAARARNVPRMARANLAQTLRDKTGDRMKALAIVLLMSLPLFCACEKQGPVQRIGEEVDEAVEDVKNGGETTGNKVDDAIDDARDGVNDAADELKKN